MGKETFEFPASMKQFFKRDQIVRAIAPFFTRRNVRFSTENGNPRNIQSFEKTCLSSDPIVPHFSPFFYGLTMGLSPSPERKPEIPGSNFGLSGSVAQMEEICWQKPWGCEKHGFKQKD